MEKDGYKSNKTDKLFLKTYNINKKFNPIFHRNRIPTPMRITKILQMIDRNPDNFKHWACIIICVKSPCNCENYKLVSRYVCCKLY